MLEEYDDGSSLLESKFELEVKNEADTSTLSGGELLIAILLFGRLKMKIYDLLQLRIQLRNELSD